MQTKSILALAVLASLSGCGSDSGTDSDNGNIAAGGIIITGMDGYYQNAVIFDDANNNGTLDIDSDTIYGLTDDIGQLTLDASTSITGTLALQVIAPGGTAQSNLISYNSATYAGVYTIDTDYPNTTLSEIVLRTPTSSVGADSAVISPITDLVTIQLEDNDAATDDEIASAEAAVADALGIETSALYKDYVAGENADSSTHKTAQILAASKANAGETDYVDASLLVATKAAEVVDALSTDEIEDINTVPVVVISGDSDTSYSVESVSNSIATVSSDTFDTIETALVDLSAQEEGSISEQIYDISGLFSDEDLGSNSTPDITLSYDLETSTGISITLENTDLMISADSILAGEDVSFTLSINDIASDSTIVGGTTASFTLPVEALNNAPTVDDSAQSSLQDEVSSWSLNEGEIFDGSFTIESLFEDVDGDALSYSSVTTATGLSVDISDVTVVVSGSPTVSGSDYSLTITASDGENETSATFTLPEIAEGVSEDDSANELEGTTWYLLEHGSDDGDDSTDDYTRVWCDSLRFEDGIVYGNVRSIANKTECSAAGTQKYGGTYEIVDGEINASFTFAGETENTTVSLEDDADEISSGAKVVLFAGERYTYFSSQADAEQRINISSEDGPTDRAFNMYLPDDTDMDWNLGTVSVSLSDSVNNGDSGEMDANVFFDVPNENFDCDMVEEFYDDFLFTGDDISNVYSTECYTNEENGVSYAAIDFDLPSLTEGNVYSIIGRVLDNQGEYVEAVKFNVTWTGTGNNE